MSVLQTSENVFRRQFWLGDIDARVPALLRVALGLLASLDLVDRLRDFHAFYAPGGILPGPLEGMDPGLRWSLFSLTDSRAATLALFLAGFPLAVSFALGYRARLANVLLWVFMVSLQSRNPHVCDGGDMVLQALLFWSMAVDTGAAFSLDVALGRRRPQRAVAAIGVRALQLQVAIIYAATFVAKTGTSWQDGTAVYRALVSTDWGRGLAPLVAAHPDLCRALTYATLIIEGAFPLLVLSPWRTTTTRAIAVASGLALHAGIFLTMRVGIFSLVMPASYLVFVSPAFIDRMQGLLARRFPRLVTAPAPALPADDAAPARGRSHRVVVVVVVIQLALVVADQISRVAHFRMPRPLSAELTLVNQRQNWRMFAPDAPLVDVTWRAPGRLADGRDVELTEGIIPELSRHGGFIYSRWHRLRNSLLGKSLDVLPPLGRYVCGRWRLAHPPRPGEPVLVSFQIIARAHPTLSADPPHDEVVMRQSCVAY